MKRISALALLLILLVMTTLSSCGKETPDTATVTTTTAESEDRSPIDVLPQSEKAGWRDPVKAIILSVLPNGDSPAERAMGAGLLDLDLDGVPEVILAYPGGSAGNTCFDVRDLNTGELRGFFGAGWYGDKQLGELAVYLDTETSRYIYVGQANYRIGRQTMERSVYTITLDDKGQFKDKQLFLEEYSYPADWNQTLVGDATVVFKAGGNTITHEDYFSRLEAFWQKLVKIEGTDFVCIDFDDVQGETNEEIAEAVADSLVNSTQEFVKGDEIN